MRLVTSEMEDRQTDIEQAFLSFELPGPNFGIKGYFDPGMERGTDGAWPGWRGR